MNQDLQTHHSHTSTCTTTSKSDNNTCTTDSISKETSKISPIMNKQSHYRDRIL